MAANPHRGEVSVDLVLPSGGKKTFTLRPTFEAMVKIETLTGVGMVALARRVAALNFGFRDAAAIIFAGMDAAGEPAKYDAVGGMIMKTGLTNLTPALQEFLGNAISGGEPPGEPEPGEAQAAGGET